MPPGTPQDPYLPPPESLVYFASHGILFVHCATCGAAPGVYCTRRGGSRDINRYYSRRWDQQVLRFHPAREAIVGLGYCGQCRVAPGEYCVTATGRPATPHRARRPWRAQVDRSPRVYPPYWPGVMSLARARHGSTCTRTGWIARLQHWRVAVLRLVRGPMGRG